MIVFSAFRASLHSDTDAKTFQQFGRKEVNRMADSEDCDFGGPRNPTNPEEVWDKKWADFLEEVWHLGQIQGMTPRANDKHAMAIFFKRLGQAIFDWMLKWGFQR